MKLKSAKQVIAVRFVVGTILLIAGLITCMYVLQNDVLPITTEALDAGQQPQIDSLLMLKGVAPLAVALIGFKLIRWGSLKAESGE